MLKFFCCRQSGKYSWDFLKLVSHNRWSHDSFCYFTNQIMGLHYFNIIFTPCYHHYQSETCLEKFCVWSEVKKKLNVFGIFCCILRGRTIAKLKFTITGIAKFATKLLKINPRGEVGHFFAACLRVLLRVSTPLRIFIRCYATRATTPGTWDTCGLYFWLFFRWRAAILFRLLWF